MTATTSQTDEQALEFHIERALTGTCLEALKAENQPLDEAKKHCHEGSYYVGDKRDFNAEYGMDTLRFWDFLERTQAEKLEKLKRNNDWQLKILQRLDRMIKKDGVLQVLKKGLKVDDATFTLLYQAPMASSSQMVKDNFASNAFSITRQVQYNRTNRLEEIDMVIFINGLAVATMELKNPWTGQNARVDGIKQYQTERDNTQPLLQFGRCLVHFAVDTDEVYMCTRLAGKNSFFLPFNKGHNEGKGNPPNPDGHKTAYLWENILQKESLAKIIQHFILYETRKGKKNPTLADKTLIFPRYHQLDVVRSVLQHASTNGTGQRYLIQHSAGSGKSHSITWLAYQLIEVYQEQQTSKQAKPLFDSVIVVTDRRILDKQLRENIGAFSEVKNLVAPAHSSRDLQDSLEQGKKIIITTIQKFPFIIDGIGDLSEKNFAVLIDEAHSSQSGSAAGSMNAAMGMNPSSDSDSDAEDIQDKIDKIMAARKMRGNASYLAFTATPKNNTLERFGVKTVDGRFEPFHLYSMKQAIEEGFILDVLANYSTYKSYYEIVKSIEDNPLFDKSKAQKKLRAFVERNPRTIKTKAHIMLDHFMAQVFKPKKLNGKAKAMVVTQDIESAIRYYLAFKTELEDKGNPFQIAIAFSGEKEVDGLPYTEAQLNGFSDSDLREQFDGDDYRILVVANKYLTGFDQPKLTAMYVDKRLQHVLAVQALSRLNRSANALGKRTEDIFVLDFFNTVDDIKEAFDPFYTSTSLSKETDVNVLHDLKDTLDDVGVYEWHEIEQFVERFFSALEASQLSPIIDIASERFNQTLNLTDEEKADYKIKSKQFVKVYAQMASLLPYEMAEWEKLFWFLKFLIPKMVVVNQTDVLIDELLESIDLSTYGIERTKLGHTIGLDAKTTELDPQNANPRSAHNAEEEVSPLDEIINDFNKRWFEGWNRTPDEAREIFIQIGKAIRERPDFKAKVANNPDKQNGDMAFKTMLDDVMSERRDGEMELFKLFKQDEAFYRAFFNAIREVVK